VANGDDTGVPQVPALTFILALSVLVVMLVRNLVTSTYGRSWVAIRVEELGS
jgi:ABC-type branched-subunit amino acid transport system permease subunit